MRTYPLAQRLKAVQVWVLTRNLGRTHEISGIPILQLRRWQTRPWWINAVAAAKKEQNELLDGKLSEIIDLSINTLKDRLEGGDYHYNPKTKETVRVPVDAKSATTVLAETFKERQLVRGEATTRSESKNTDEKFALLKERFEQLARSKQINPNTEVIEHESVQKAGEGTETGPDPEHLREETLEEDSEYFDDYEEDEILDDDALDEETEQIISRE